MDVHIQTATQSLPLSRSELFIDVMQNNVYGKVCQTWQLQGHIFITTDEGRKLFTFDCKPIHHHHVFGSNSLDISSLLAPLVDVMTVSQGMIILIDTDGKVMFWKFTPDFSWSNEGNIQICTSDGAEVVSATYLLEYNTLFWCERQPTESPSSVSPTSSSTYCICKRYLCSDLEPRKILEQCESSVIIQNCPPIDVHTLSSNFIFMSTQFDSEQVMIHLTFDVASNCFTIYVGEEAVSCLVTSEEALDFQKFVLRNLSVLMQAEPGRGDLGTLSDSSMGQTAVLSSNGQLDVYSCASDSRKTTLSKKTVTLSCGSSQIFQVQTKHWFLHRGHVGIFCDKTIYIFRLDDGKHVCKCIQDNFGNVEKVIRSTSPKFLVWFLTSDQLFSVQGFETNTKEMYTSADKLPDDHLLQTYTMKLAHLQELRMQGYDQTLVKEFEQLQRKWPKVKNLVQHSHISNITAPYLEEYWRLENLSQALLDSEKQPVIKADVNPAQNMVKTLTDSRSLSKTAQHAKLIWFSEVHPEELLDYLCQGITFDSSMIQTSELKKWQSLLGMDGSNLLNFEFVCRLLFRLKPEKLLNFVRCAESVSEQTIGVSAFVRKKHTLIYYKTAWECLPHTQASCNSKMAASVKARLIMASESENCVDRALKCLLQNGLWSEAVELVEGQAGNEVGLAAYLHITIRALAESHVLPDYIEKLLAVMPSWKSILSFSQLVVERPEIRAQQLSNSAKNVFYHGSPDIQLGALRPFLLNLLKK